MNWKSSYLSTDLFIKWFAENFLNNKASGKVILLSRWPHSSHLLLQTAVENNVTIIPLPSQCTHALQTLDKCYFGSLNSYFKNEAATLKSLDIARRPLLGLLGINLLAWMLG